MKRLKIILLWSTLAGFVIALLAQEYSNNKEFEFSHQLHVVEEEIECADCHEAAESSKSGLDNLMPTQSVCLDCHEAEEIGNFDLVYAIENYSMKFSHAGHLAAGANCESCHSNINEKVEAFPYALPNMADCMSCHELNAVSVGCATCHMPLENLRPVSHTINYIHAHGDMARLDAQEISADMSCATCHQTQFCQDCHAGENIDRFSHPLNYQFTHAMEAQNKERECAACHSEPEFCISCHRDNNVLPRNHTTGWINNFPGSGGRHSVEARNDLENCISCHEQNAALICQPCHGN